MSEVRAHRPLHKRGVDRHKFMQVPILERCRDGMAELQLTEEDLVAYEGVVAGHEGMLSNLEGDLIVKPCTRNELEFYQGCVAQDAPILPYIPTFMGTLHLTTPEQRKALGHRIPSTVHNEESGSRPSDVNGTGSMLASSASIPLHGKKLDTDQAIVLENVAAGFVNPCIMDIKVGARLWADDALPAKRERLEAVARQTTSGSLGFRISGMRIWNPGLQERRVYDKLYGRSLTEETAVNGFRDFFGQSMNEHKLAVLDLFRRGSEALKEALEAMETRIYSSSVLMVYEGDPEALSRALDAAQEEIANGEEGGAENDDDSDEEDTGLKICRLVLIDFAHATFAPGQGHDRNMTRGIDNIVKIMNRLA